jgi:hypothetical protein
VNDVPEATSGTVADTTAGAAAAADDPADDAADKAKHVAEDIPGATAPIVTDAKTATQNIASNIGNGKSTADKDATQS